jgi:hypothetical protein
MHVNFPRALEDTFPDSKKEACAILKTLASAVPQGFASLNMPSLYH